MKMPQHSTPAALRACIALFMSSTISLAACAFADVTRSCCVCCSFSANHRRAGHAVTNILAKELMQEDAPSSMALMKKAKLDEKDEHKIEGGDSLEELLEAAPTRSS